jgi:hypothetical protein
LLPGDFLQIGPYPLPITDVAVTSGVLQIFSSAVYSFSLSTLLLGASLSFSGLTNATWLNGAVLEVDGVTEVGLGILITMATVPPGMPGSYAEAADTGTATWGAARLYQYVDAGPLSSDSSGDATLDIFPSLRETYPPGTRIALINPQGTFRLAENRRTASADQKKTIVLKLKCREAI